MKLFMVCFLGVVALSTAVPTLLPKPNQPATKPEPSSRGCIYALGHCVKQCPEGTHAYATGCSQKKPEPTCEEPKPAIEEAIICDFSDCYCDEPTVKDTKSGKCMKLEDCPKKA